MLSPRVLKSVTVTLSAILIATGTALGPVNIAAAEEIPSGSSATSTPQPGEDATPSPSPSPSSTPTPTPTPTTEPSDGPTAPVEQPSDAPTEAPEDGEEPAPQPPSEEAPAPDPAEEPAPPAPEAVSPLAEAEIGTFAMSARAISGGDFRPGLIISDYNFYNGSAMTEAQIQAFLDAKCSGASCLNNVRMTTPTRTWSYGTCSTYQGGANESAARIIDKVQRACGISAKALLVILQKETSLVSMPSSDSRFDSHMRKAMGYGCPDTSSCDSMFYGFFNQMFAAARQLVWYSNPEASMYNRFPARKTSAVGYHPNAACGSSSVYIENDATHALYNYTPYQPNAVALSNVYGSQSDGCSSYGNRNFWVFYNDWFGDPTDGRLPNVSRISGADRFSTAVGISKSSYPNAGVPVVYITTGESFPDALSAAPAAATQGGPLLLTFPTELPGATRDELARLKPQRIVVVGGVQAVNKSVYAQLEKIQPNIQRISGVDRYETSRKIAATVFPRATSAYVATGLNFPDALSASAAAGAKGIPVLLVDDSRDVHPATLSLLGSMGATSVKIVGGANAVSGTQESGFRGAGLGITRLSGSDRIGTSIAINDDAFPSASTVYLATAVDYPDALAGAAAAGKAKSPLFVSFPGCMPAATRDSITSRQTSSLLLLGGTSALSPTVAQLGRC